MASPARHLHAVPDHVVDEHGEVVTPEALVAEIEKLRIDLKMAQRDVKSKNRKINELERDRAQEREHYERRKDVERIWSYWNRRLGQDKALTGDRFDAVRGMLEEVRLVQVEGKRRAVREPAYTLEDFKAAIDGCWFDPFITKRRNGTELRHNDLALVCRDGKTFESFIAKAPKSP